MSSEPGWYRDPTGRAGDARWHDGYSWTDQHLPRESLDDSFVLTDLPSVSYLPSTYTQDYAASASDNGPAQSQRNPTAVYDVVSAPAPRQNSFAVQYAEPAAAPPLPPEDKPNRRPLWWGIGALASLGLILVLLISTGAFSAVNQDDSAQSGGVIDVPASPTDSSQIDIRVIDKESGISYAYLGEGWKDWIQGDQLEQKTTVGEYIVTQEDTPAGGQFIAQVTSGPLSEEFGPAPASAFKAISRSLLTSVRETYYPLPNTDSPLVDEAFEIDGHKAYKYGVDLKWDVDGYDSTGERVVLILIDTGKDRPAFVYCSFPNTHAELYPLIDEAIASIKVDA